MNYIVQEAASGLTGGLSGEIRINSRPEDLSPLESAIFDRLQSASKWDPVTRRELVFLTKSSDRKVRDAIAALRKKHVRVCTSSSRYGYWIAKTEEDYRILRGEYISRIKTLATTLAAMDGVVEGQLSWHELL